jgi:hypothetical protein
MGRLRSRQRKMEKEMVDRKEVTDDDSGEKTEETTEEEVKTVTEKVAEEMEDEGLFRKIGSVRY